MDQTGVTYRAVSVFQAIRGSDAALEHALVSACRAIAGDPGLIGITIARSQDTPGGFLVTSRWPDRSALTACYRHTDRIGWIGRISELCDHVGFDVLYSCDPPGARAPAPDRPGAVIVSCVMIPDRHHVADVRALLGVRADLLQQEPGCVWMEASAHADRSDFFQYCSGWDSRDDRDRAAGKLSLPYDRDDLSHVLRGASFDVLDPVAEMGPDTMARHGTTV